MTRRLDGVTAVIFDVNGTLVHIRTDEHLEEIYRSVGHFLTYQGVDLRRDQVRDEYFSRLKHQKRESPEAHPEFDAVQIWRSIIDDFASDYTRALPAQRRAELPVAVAEIFRGVSRKKLKLYPHVRHVLNRLRERYPLAIVSDAQSAYARAELHKVRILDYFDPIIVSGDHGFRKPDVRLFEYALAGLNVTRGTVRLRGQRHVPRRPWRAGGGDADGDVRVEPGGQALQGLRTGLPDQAITGNCCACSECDHASPARSRA